MLLKETFISLPFCVQTCFRFLWLRLFLLLCSLSAICGARVCVCLLWLVLSFTYFAEIYTVYIQNDAAINFEIANERNFGIRKKRKKTLATRHDYELNKRKKYRKRETKIRSKARWICLLRIAWKMFRSPFRYIDNMICCLVLSKNVFFSPILLTHSLPRTHSLVHLFACSVVSQFAGKIDLFYFHLAKPFFDCISITNRLLAVYISCELFISTGSLINFGGLLSNVWFGTKLDFGRNLWFLRFGLVKIVSVISIFIVTNVPFCAREHLNIAHKLR